jgi:hypothetical protein
MVDNRTRVKGTQSTMAQHLDTTVAWTYRKSSPKKYVSSYVELLRTGSCRQLDAALNLSAFLVEDRNVSQELVASGVIDFS